MLNHSHWVKTVQVCLDNFIFIPMLQFLYVDDVIFLSSLVRSLKRGSRSRFRHIRSKNQVMSAFTTVAQFQHRLRHSPLPILLTRLAVASLHNCIDLLPSEEHSQFLRSINSGIWEAVSDNIYGKAAGLCVSKTGKVFVTSTLITKLNVSYFYAWR